MKLIVILPLFALICFSATEAVLDRRTLEQNAGLYRRQAPAGNDLKPATSLDTQSTAKPGPDSDDKKDKLATSTAPGPVIVGATPSQTGPLNLLPDDDDDDDDEKVAQLNANMDPVGAISPGQSGLTALKAATPIAVAGPGLDAGSQAGAIASGTSGIGDSSLAVASASSDRKSPDSSHERADSIVDSYVQDPNAALQRLTNDTSMVAKIKAFVSADSNFTNELQSEFRDEFGQKQGDAYFHSLASALNLSSTSTATGTTGSLVNTSGIATSPSSASTTKSSSSTLLHDSAPSTFGASVNVSLMIVFCSLTIVLLMSHL